MTYTYLIMSTGVDVSYDEKGRLSILNKLSKPIKLTNMEEQNQVVETTGRCWIISQKLCSYKLEVDDDTFIFNYYPGNKTWKMETATFT